MIKRLFSFLGSYIFAIILMIGLGIILAVGTVCESRLSTEAAQQLIYKTDWFIGLLALLFLNVLISALKRWPYKKYHTGFIITHIGLLLLLAGSMISKIWGVEGTLALQEGESASSFETKIETLSIAHDEGFATFEKRFTSWVNHHAWEKSLPYGGPELIVDGYWPNSKTEDFYTANGDPDNLALLLSLSNSMTGLEQWLEIKDPSKNSVDLGPVTIKLDQLKTSEDVAHLLAPTPTLEAASSPATLKITISEKGLSHDYPIDSSIGKLIPIEGTDLQIKILAFYSHAFVEDGKLKNKSEEFINPAVEFEISGPKGTQHNIAFSLYPDFNTLHEPKNNLYDLKSSLICKDHSTEGKSLITIFRGPENKLYYHLQSKQGKVQTGPLSLQKPLETGWMGLELTIKEMIQGAGQEHKILETPSDPKYENNTPAIHVRLLGLGPAEQSNEGLWIQRGTQNALHVQGHHFDIEYGYKKISLGAQITLQDFTVSYYPGSDSPMSYESKVQVLDSEQNINKEARIYMNHTLTHRGYKFFQASYVQGNENEPDISVLSVNHDPGVYLIYGGSIVMILGIYLLFFTRFFKRKGAVIAVLFFIHAFAPFAHSEDSFDYSKMDRIAVQHGGRIKPFQTFANETVKLITGRENFEGKKSTEQLLTWAADPAEALKKKVIRITFRPILESTQLNSEQKYFSFLELAQNEKLKEQFSHAMDKQIRREKLNPYEQKIATLYQQTEVLRSVVEGKGLTILPNLQEEKGEWHIPSDLDSYDAKFSEPFKEAFKKLLLAIQKKDSSAFNAAADQVHELLESLSRAYYAPKKIELEIFYNHIQPFQTAWILYLIAFLLSLFLVGKKSWAIPALLFIAGFIFQTLGLILRVLISGRAPVSNMYESMIFLIWGTCLFAIAFQVRSKSKVFLSVASFLGFLILVMAQSLPIDSSIAILVPVLRSNYWLTIHVLTILLSYSAFALAMGIGHFGLGVYFFQARKKELFKTTAAFIFKVIQIGVLLLIAGTILGGVWANESWGRFWGWDPKETWALISILGYLAVVHAKYAGWIEDFGLTVCSIAGFALILMTYYGVNFILAAGLHSYGFGSGGMPYVVGYLLFETIVIVLAVARKKQS